MLFADDKATLWGWQKEVERALADLRLTIHPGAQPHPVSEGIPFLGFHIFPDKIRLKRRKGIYYRQRLQNLLHQYETGEIPLESVTISVRGWINHLRFANTIGLRKKLFRTVIVPRPNR